MKILFHIAVMGGHHRLLLCDGISLIYSESKGGYCSYLLQSTFNVYQAFSLSEPFFPHWPANSIKVRALNKILLSLSLVTHSASLPLM